jgi:bifunctional UDP-N-acetylglucosamine pyrophosphorylase/glucosamine-1-phosphate N-acetyltransferase
VVETGAELGPFTQLADCRIGARAVVTATVAHNSEVGTDARVGPWAYLAPGTRIEDGTVTGAGFGRPAGLE